MHSVHLLHTPLRHRTDLIDHTNKNIYYGGTEIHYSQKVAWYRSYRPYELKIYTMEELRYRGTPYAINAQHQFITYLLQHTTDCIDQNK